MYNCIIHTDTIDGNSDTIETPRGCSFKPDAKIKRTFRTCVEGKCKSEGMDERREYDSNQSLNVQNFNKSVTNENKTSNNFNGNNQTVSRMDPLFDESNGFWESSADKNGIPQSPTAHLDPSAPELGRPGPADKYLDNKNLNTTTIVDPETGRTTTIRTSNKSLEQWEEHIKQKGINCWIAFAVFAFFFAVALYFNLRTPKYRDSNFGSTASETGLIFICIFLGVPTVALFIAAIIYTTSYEKLAEKEYEYEQRNNSSSSS